MHGSTRTSGGGKDDEAVSISETERAWREAQREFMWRWVRLFVVCLGVAAGAIFFIEFGS